MTTMNVTDARSRLPEVLESSKTEAVFLQRRGRSEAVVVSAERYEALMAAYEDVQDIQAFDQAIAESGPTIPWDQVKADLGWT